MKKFHLLIIALLFSSISLFAKSVDVNQAAQVAENFYKQATGGTVTMTLAYQCTNTDATNGLPIGETLYYAFNAPNNQGFVMVAADDLAKPVIGYNISGQFTIAGAPPAIADWFAKYGRQIAYAKVNATTTTQAITDMWTALSGSAAHITKQLRSGTGPLLSTTWDQPYPYNALCPQDASAPSENNGRVLTGCGATAMSQIMRYWSYPAQGTGNNSYVSNYGTLSVNFAANTYNWANMPNSDDPNNPSTDIAKIMYDAGVAVDMIYGPDESSSYLLPGTGVPASCEQAYTTYFGYDAATIAGYERANYPTESIWTGMIQTEMNAGRPVQYAGQGPSGGHTFVLDGDDGNGYFHVNWGWSGVDNGYYSVDALNPAPYANGNFSSDESMITGIQPPNGSVVSSSGMDLYQATAVNPDPIPFLDTFSVYAAVINNGTANFTGNYCAGLFDASGTFVRYIGDILSTSALPPNYYNTLTFSDTTSFVTIPGTYTIGIYYQASGATTWTLAGQSTYTNPISITVDGANDPGIALYSDMVPSPSTFVQGQSAAVQVNLLNDGSATYAGQFGIWLLDLQGNFVDSVGATFIQPALQAGDYDSLTFTSGTVTVAEGQYILAAVEQQQGTGVWYYCGGTAPHLNPILINVVNNEIGILAVNDIPLSTVKVYPNPASGHITIDADEIKGDYTLTIYNTIGQQMGESSGMLNGGKISADVSGYAAGLYTLQLKTASGTLNSRFVVK